MKLSPEQRKKTQDFLADKKAETWAEAALMNGAKDILLDIAYAGHKGYQDMEDNELLRILEKEIGGGAVIEFFQK